LRIALSVDGWIKIEYRPKTAIGFGVRVMRLCPDGNFTVRFPLRQS
jgi:hypothetical protein